MKNILLNREDNIPPAECIIEALQLYLNCNNSTFNSHHYLQVDGTAQGPHISCSYSDLAMYSYDLKDLSYVPAVKCWKRFRNDVFVLRNSGDDLDQFFDLMNFIDSSQKIQFTISCPTNNVLEFLDLILSFEATSKQI